MGFIKKKPATAAHSASPAKPKRQVGMGTLFGVVFVVAVAAFVVGTRTENAFAWFGSKQNADLPGQLDFTSVQQVYDKLKLNFDGQLDKQKLIDGAKKGLVDAAGDPYTVYFTNDEAAKFKNELDGKFSGIGAELGKKDGNLQIIATIDDSPARKAGLLAGDLIVKVNDDDTTNWSIEQAVSKIRGDKGTTVKLTIVRSQQLKEFSIVRADIVNPSVNASISADNIGYLRVSRFAEDTEALSKQAAADFKAKNVKGIVLDLRGNGGGYVNAATALSSLWLKQGDVVVDEKGNQSDREVANGNNMLSGIPTVVLIDSGSASASEITAGALHDHNAAKLVGVKSFGKGSVQQIIDLTSGGQLKVTVAKWFTPNGINISKEGIKPDIEVKVSDDDLSAGRDPQKDKAFELLTK
ncbi:MAG TPA: S41 family peptidase [Candidatus Saccharimonadales bacterium]|nr:S41 family peptidase [Candidatus Saccharimonadales bacterium]